MTGEPSRAPAGVRLRAELPAEWREAVEDLLFFNPQQARLEEKILETIHAFGLPKVVARDGRLGIEVGDGLRLGTLFAMAERDGESQLAGLLLFLRQGTELLCLHLSVDEEYSARGPRASLRVAAHLLDEVRRIGARIAGVEHIGIYYRREGWYKLPLKTRLL